jgi:uncharacterized membrane protein YoaK (UPF0700 family)
VHTMESTAIHSGAGAWHDAATASRSERYLPTLLSVIAGMVDLIGFLRLGMFTAHITGNVVLIGPLVVRHDRANPAQILAIAVSVLAVAATSLIDKTTGRRGPGLMRLLLLFQVLLITSVLIFSIITKASANPHWLMATIGAMIAVTAMGAVSLLSCG